MDKGNVVCIQMEFYLAIKKNEDWGVAQSGRAPTWQVEEWKALNSNIRKKEEEGEREREGEEGEGGRGGRWGGRQGREED
jgi:hypothetical protein